MLTDQEIEKLSSILASKLASKTDVKEAFDTVSKKVDNVSISLNKKVDALSETVVNLDKKIDNVNISLTEKIDTLTETVDKLAIMTKNGFDKVDKRFNQVDEKFREIDVRFNNIDNTLFAMDSKIESIDKRLIKVENLVEPLVEENKVIIKEIQNIDARVVMLEKKNGLLPA